MRIVTVLSAVVILLLFSYIKPSFALDLPDEAFRLLAQTTAEPCTICQKQEMEKAFKILNSSLVPGTMIRTDGTCHFIKPGDSGHSVFLTCYPSSPLMSSLKEEEQVPQVSFQFYTPENKLVGISESDYTGKEIADLFRAAKQGSVFEGRLKIIPFKYGEGPTYNYFKQTNRLVIHCQVLELRSSPVN